MSLNEFLKRAVDIHSKIATDVYPEGGELHCLVCDKEQAASSRDCAVFLVYGWPKCCGQVMLMTGK